MCAGESRRLWTDGDWRDDMRQWAATWQRRPGLEWSAAALMRLPEEPARAAAEGLQTSRIALLVCGGGGYAAVAPHGQTALARSRPCSLPLTQRPHSACLGQFSVPERRATAAYSRGRGEAGLTLWCRPKVADG